jgi:hypothetical protein
VIQNGSCGSTNGAGVVCTDVKENVSVGRNKLQSNDNLIRNQSLVSNNQCFEMDLTDDGNLILFRLSDKQTIWATDTAGSNASQVKTRKINFETLKLANLGNKQWTLLNVITLVQTKNLKH